MDAGSPPIMTYGGGITKRGGHAPKEFYPHRPAGPPLRRRDRPGPSEAPRPRPQVPRRAAAHLVVLCRRPHHLAVGGLSVLARCPLRRGGPPGPDRHLPDFAELLRRLNAALAGDLPRPVRRRPQRLAADL